MPDKKPADDQNTDPAGNPGSKQGSGDQPDEKTGKEGQDPTPKPTPPVEGKKAAKKPEPKASDGEDEEEKILTITQPELNRMFADRAAKARKDADAELTEMKAQLEAVTKERDTFRTAEVEKVKAQFEALPAEVKDVAALAFDIAKINEGDTFAKVVAWLPKGTALAAKLNPSAPGTKPTDPPAPKPSNPPGPKPVGKSDKDKEEALKAAQKQMARSF